MTVVKFSFENLISCFIYQLIKKDTRLKKTKGDLLLLVAFFRKFGPKIVCDPCDT